MSNKNILLVEDETIVAMTIEDALSKLGYTVVGSATSGEEAIKVAGRLRPDLVLMDIRLDGEMDGIDAARRIHECFQIPFIFLTAHSDEGTLHRAAQTLPYGYLIKPFQDRELHTTIEIAIHKHRAVQSEVLLDKRIKELNCLYGISRLVERCTTTGELLQGTVDLIPAAWRHSDTTSARIVYEGCEYETAHFSQSPWQQKASIMVGGNVAGCIEVFVLRDDPSADEDSYLYYERNLLESIAERIGKEIVRRRLEEQKQEAMEQIEKNFEQFAILNDQIRNPLTAIYGLAELGNSEFTEKIIEQAGIIDSIVKELDKRWLESEKVRTYLKKHHSLVCTANQ